MRSKSCCLKFHKMDICSFAGSSLSAGDSPIWHSSLRRQRVHGLSPQALMRAMTFDALVRLEQQQHDNQDFIPEADQHLLDLVHLRFSYPPGAPCSLLLGYTELELLDKKEFLSNSFIAFGLKKLLEDIQSRDAELAKGIHIFDPLFYSRLTASLTDNAGDVHSGNTLWTAKVDVFAKRFIVVPVHVRDHWLLVIIKNLP